MTQDNLCDTLPVVAPRRVMGMSSISGAVADQWDGMFPLEDIAYGLRSVPRFGGQTQMAWSVLDHLVTCERYANDLNKPPILRLHLLLHDAHEAFTGDVPCPFKTPELYAIQRSLDERLYKMLGVPEPTAEEKHAVKLIDNEMLLAEAKVVCNTSTYSLIAQEMGGRALPGPLQAVYRTLDLEDGISWHTRVRRLVETVRGK